MNTLQIRDLVPSPFCEIIFTPRDIQAVGRAFDKQPPEEILRLQQGEVALKEAESMIRGALHLSLLISGWFAIHSLEWSFVTTLILGCTLSMPSMLMAGSFYGLSFGARSLLYSLGTGALWQFAVGISSIGGSYSTLDQLKGIHFGFLEDMVDLIAERGALKLTIYLLRTA